MRIKDFFVGFDPRTKLCIVVVISTLGVIIDTLFLQLGLFVFTLLLLMLFGVDLSNIYPKIKRFAPLFLGLLVIQSVFSPTGDPLLIIKGIPVITQGGIIKGLSVILRMLIIISCVMILATSNSQDIIMGLVKMKIPYEIAYMVLIAIRFLPILVEEFKDVITAIQLRGVEIKKITFGKKLKVYTYILMPVVASAIIRAKKIATAMEARAFRAYPERTYLSDLVLHKKDYIAMVFFIIFGISCFVLYVLGGSYFEGVFSYRDKQIR